MKCSVCNKQLQSGEFCDDLQCPNPAQSDRQNGDGLRTFDTAGTILRRTVNGFTITCESAEIADRVADQLRTPQPARDAAERSALDRENHWRKLEGRNLAPPKPAPSAPGHTDLMVTPESVDAFIEKNPLSAPDAMREALVYTAELCIERKYQWCIVKVLPRVETVIENFGGGPDAYKAAEEKLPSIKAALAAPVPPADGVISLAEILLGFQSAYEEVGVTPPIIEPETSAEYMASLRSPSGTGAAEPVAWQFRRSNGIGKGPQSQASWSGWCGIERADYEGCLRAPNKLIEVRALYAAPPLRRDLESLYSIFKKYLPANAERDSFWQEVTEWLHNAR